MSDAPTLADIEAFKDATVPGFREARRARQALAVSESVSKFLMGCRADGIAPAVVSTKREARHLRRLASALGFVQKWRIGDEYYYLRTQNWALGIKNPRSN